MTHHRIDSMFPETSGAFLDWQQDWGTRLAGRLMNGGLPVREPMEAQTLEAIYHPLFTLSRVRYRTMRDRTNTYLLSMPVSVKEPLPLLLALHGHEAAWGEADAAAFTPGHPDDFCAYFAERGWAVLQPATMDHTLQHANWTLQGEWTWDAMVALDHALGLPQVDAQRVAVCGLSTGAHLAMNMLALDERVKAGVVGCVFSTWNHYRTRMLIPPHCDCGILGQLGDLIEQSRWAALAAPKPVQFQHGRQDAAFCPGADPALLLPDWNTAVMPKEEFEMAFADVERAYNLTNAPEKVSLHIHPFGHRVDNPAAYDFLTHALNTQSPTRPYSVR